MFPPIVTDSPEKTTQQPGKRRESHPDSAQSFQGRLHPIVQLQRRLGNRRVAELIQAKRLTPEGQIHGLQQILTVGAALEIEPDRAADAMVAGAPALVSAASGSATMLHRVLPEPSAVPTGPMAPPSAVPPAPGQSPSGTPLYSEEQRRVWLDKCSEANTAIDEAATMARIYLSTMSESYSAAWEMHEDALKEAAVRQKKAEDLIMGFVIAGIGGAAGGAVGVFVGNMLGDAMKKLWQGVAIIDFSKDLAKFAVRKGHGALPGLEEVSPPKMMPMPLAPAGFSAQIGRTVDQMVILPAQTALKEWQHVANDPSNETLDLTMDPALGIDTYLTQPIAHWVPLDVAAQTNAYACGFLNEWIQTEAASTYQKSLGLWDWTSFSRTIIAYGTTIGFQDVEAVLGAVVGPLILENIKRGAAPRRGG